MTPIVISPSLHLEKKVAIAVPMMDFVLLRIRYLKLIVIFPHSWHFDNLTGSNFNSYTVQVCRWMAGI